MKLRRRARLETLVPIASMGDIAFLLIIFFMLAANIKESKIKYAPPTSEDLARFKKTTIISVTMDEDGVLYLQGEMIAVESLEGEIAMMIEGKQEKSVRLKIDKTIPAEKFRPVLMALSKAGAQLDMVGEKPKKVR